MATPHAVNSLSLCSWAKASVSASLLTLELSHHQSQCDVSSGLAQVSVFTFFGSDCPSVHPTSLGSDVGKQPYPPVPSSAFLMSLGLSRPLLLTITSPPVLVAFFTAEMKYLTRTTYRRRTGLSAFKFKGHHLMVACQPDPKAEIEAEKDESCCSAPVPFM